MNAAPAPLRLRARDVEDLAVISALVQDALVAVHDIAYLPEAQRFVLAVNRFRWEAEAGSAAEGERVHAGLRFEGVGQARFRGIDRGRPGRVLSLLAIAHDAGSAILHFAEGAAIQLEVAALDCVLEDMDEPWPALRRPQHAPD
ncbi:MAG: DUF2948 family protein [Alphaproteobacteria bacterium]